ncbi:His-Xaa-Ser system radical SAM maturase HxsB [Lachnospiraceae bacterium XPB1003]|nr:His-Xaa-Ser system radical SAM maturase HxsB [Lachnospiraceae bacterium XPB1003]
MINYFNFKKFNDKYLITNDFGRHQFVSFDTLKKLVNGDEELDEHEYSSLKDDFFITGDSQHAYLEKCTPYLRDAKSHLFQPTSLFIFVLTNSCNLNCVYCQAQSESSIKKGLMSKEIAKKGVDIALQSPTDAITIEFQGGEPLLNFDTIKYIIEYSSSVNSVKAISYNLVSNLSLLTEEIADYLCEHRVQVSVSLDGPDYVHNNNRPFRIGGGSYEAAIRGIEMLRSKGVELGAIQTTTKHSLNHAKSIIDTYVELGFGSIFIRPLTQLGYAQDHWDKIGYSAEEFIEFYKESLNYLINRNSNGILISEGHATIFLTKILRGFSNNYMELRSPCGATIGQMAFYYDGNIYTCDEGRMVAEMGDSAFRLGDVFSCDYNKLLDSGVCKTVCSASCLEAIPGCCDCVYQPYCGVCPVINYAVDKDLFARKTNNRCKIYSGILDYLFDIFKNKPENVDIFKRWIV